ncbi:MAG: hypothetical protein WBN41_16010, partial [Lysobacterales bacterium]
ALSIAPIHKSNEGKNDLEMVFHGQISGFLKFCDETKALIIRVFMAVLLGAAPIKNTINAVSS